MSEPSCLGCDLISGARLSPGGPLLRRHGFLLHAVAAPSPLRGWLVLTALRHVRGLYELDPAEASGLGALAAEVMRAQRAVLGAEHVYAFAIGDVLPHLHLHLVPRFSETPERLRGRRCFDFLEADVVPEDQLAEAAARISRTLLEP